MEVVDRTLLNETVTAGADVVVRADLSNYHPARGRITLNLTADSTLVAQRTVTVGIDAERTVHLRTRFDAPGRYEMRLDDVSVGTVNVVQGTETATMSPAATRTPTPVSTPAQTPTATPSRSGSATEAADSTPVETNEPVPPETTSGSGPGFGVLIGAVATLTGYSIARRRRSG